MSLQEFTSKAQKLSDFVDRVAEKLSYETGFVQRRSKMTGSVFAKSILTGWLKQPQASLEMLCKRVADFGVKISPQGLGKRFNREAVVYLQGLLQHCLHEFQSKQRLEIPLLQQFKSIYLIDSTQVALPQALVKQWVGSGGHASASALKMHLTFDFLRGNVSAIDLTHGASADSQHSIVAEAGSLYLFDLGYFTINRFKHIQQQHAFFISRLRPNTLLFDQQHSTTPLDLGAFCHALKTDTYETTLFLGAHDHFPVRVVFCRCPQAVIEERRRKALATAKRKGRTYSDLYLTLLEWSIFITNVPHTRLTLPQVIQLYGIRWQIELLFKLCKSHLHLDSVQGCGENRILCQLYARLIVFVLLCDLVSAFRLDHMGELSLVKSFHLFSDFADRLIAAFNGSIAALAHLLLHLKDDFLRFARKTKRKKSPSTLALFVYDFP